MRNLKLSGGRALLAAMFLLLSGCAGGGLSLQEYPADHILSLEEIRRLPEGTNPNDYVLALDKGAVIPIEITLKSEVAGFAQDHVDLVLKEKLYLRAQVPEPMSKQDWHTLKQAMAGGFRDMSPRQTSEFLKKYMLYISKDTRHWAALADPEACKRLLGIDKGEFSVSLGASSEAGLRGHLFIALVPVQK